MTEEPFVKQIKAPFQIRLSVDSDCDKIKFHLQTTTKKSPETVSYIIVEIDVQKSLVDTTYFNVHGLRKK